MVQDYIKLGDLRGTDHSLCSIQMGMRVYPQMCETWATALYNPVDNIGHDIQGLLAQSSPFSPHSSHGFLRSASELYGGLPIAR
jgi:hypothetical protein